ncbi:unnamed protein product [Clavelina lepadiformis]|uniref:Uncharacterized protein n=1 Tax=Clavelina lepadiformis TaxID=159417 RepID=A0ABP0FJP5_CLALP
MLAGLLSMAVLAEISGVHAEAEFRCAKKQLVCTATHGPRLSGVCNGQEAYKHNSDLRFTKQICHTLAA